MSRAPMTPCKSCTERTAGCHGSCEAYKEYVKINEEYKQSIKEYKATDSLLYSYYIENSRKIKKKMR